MIMICNDDIFHGLQLFCALQSYHVEACRHVGICRSKIRKFDIQISAIIKSESRIPENPKICEIQKLHVRDPKTQLSFTRSQNL